MAIRVLRGDRAAGNECRHAPIRERKRLDSRMAGVTARGCEENGPPVGQRVRRQVPFAALWRRQRFRRRAVGIHRYQPAFRAGVDDSTIRHPRRKPFRQVRGSVSVDDGAAGHRNAEDLSFALKANHAPIARKEGADSTDRSLDRLRLEREEPSRMQRCPRGGIGRVHEQRPVR